MRHKFRSRAASFNRHLAKDMNTDQDESLMEADDILLDLDAPEEDFDNLDIDADEDFDADLDADEMEEDFDEDFDADEMSENTNDDLVIVINDNGEVKETETDNEDMSIEYNDEPAEMSDEDMFEEESMDDEMSLEMKDNKEEADRKMSRSEAKLHFRNKLLASRRRAARARFLSNKGFKKTKANDMLNGASEENTETENLIEEILKGDAIDNALSIETPTPTSEELVEKVDGVEQTITIEINNPESVVIAPEELNAEELPTELLEDYNSPEELYTKGLTYNLAHLLTKNDYQNQIELVASSLEENITPSYYIMVKQMPVAVAEFNKASENIQSMFSDRETFMRSLQVVLSNCDSKETTAHLKDFGIRPIVMPIISNKAVVANNVLQATRSLEKAFKEKEADMFNKFRESFSIAAVMYCKNLQNNSTSAKPKSLVSKSLLIDTLKSVNIANASVLVNEAFKKGILNDYAVIVEEALSLYSKTPEARKEVMDFTVGAEYRSDGSLDSIQAQHEIEQSNSVTASSGSYTDETFDTVALCNAIRKGAL